MQVKASLVEKISKNGNPYKVLVLTIGNRDVEVHANYADIRLLEFLLEPKQ